jgi:hypothetical protein
MATEKMSVSTASTFTRRHTWTASRPDEWCDSQAVESGVANGPVSKPKMSYSAIRDRYLDRI